MKGALLALVVALALGAGCKGSTKEGGSKDGADARGGGRRGRGGGAGAAFAVDAMTIEAKKMRYTVNAPGTIDAFERVQVTARVAGAIDRVGFTEGQSVKKGDVLVVIDSERFRVAVASAQAALAKSDVAVRDADAMVARREAAAGKTPGIIPGEELESYRTKAASARADRAVAAQALRTAELNLRDSSVRAPIQGVIQTRTVETGQYVQAGYVMATLLRAEPLLLRFQIEPSEAPRIKPDMVATFTMRETQRSFKAKITLVAGSADATTHMVGVTGEVVDEGHKYWLRPGSFCDVTVEVDAQRDAVMIPRLAARATDHGYVAYVVEGEVAKERTLALGMSTKDGWIEVRSGLKAGDVLVVRGAEALTDGAKVKVSRVTADALDKPVPAPAPQGSGSAGPPAADASGSARPRRRKEAAP